MGVRREVEEKHRRKSTKKLEFDSLAIQQIEPYLALNFSETFEMLDLS